MPKSCWRSCSIFQEIRVRRKGTYARPRMDGARPGWRLPRWKRSGSLQFSDSLTMCNQSPNWLVMHRIVFELPFAGTLTPRTVNLTHEVEARPPKRELARGDVQSVRAGRLHLPCLHAFVPADLRR